MKRVLAFLLTLPLLLSVATVSAFAATPSTFTITGYEEKNLNGGIILYEAGSKDRTLSVNDYPSLGGKLLMFDKDGQLYEAGGGIIPNSDSYYGAQSKVTIPAGGFLIAFDSNNSELYNLYTRAMGDIMIYNATVSMIFNMSASFDKSTNKLTVTVGELPKVTANTKKFLFVGNSSTYFNGNPIKFEALCRAAGLDVKVYYSTFGSAYLHEFADATHTRGISLRNKLNSTKYSYVVLQDASGATHEDGHKSIETLLPLIQANGAEPLLYMRYSTSIAGAKKHYDNYTKLAEEFGIRTDYTAVAFAYVMEKYPEINLIAEDGGHHSKEGSYLAACCWLYAYLGVNPVGNTYTAGLKDDVALKLQQEAYRACTTEYDPAGIKNKEIDGVSYQLLSKGKSYKPTGAEYSGNWTDTENGKPIGKFTDGDIATEGSDTIIGCYKGTSQSITIDLGSVQQIKYIFTDVYGNFDWGIPDPQSASIEVLVSENGSDFVSVGKMNQGEAITDGNWKRIDFTLTLSELQDARYIRLSYSLAGNFLWSSEIAVYGNKPEEPDVQWKRGDVDGNGTVETKDYVKLKRYVLNTYKTTDEAEIKRMNVDLKGSVDSKDYVMLKRAVLQTYKFENEFVSEKDFK